MKGTIFDISEFTLYDGPGVRTTIFLKGCPLRCAWCHNPEGLDIRPQLMVANNTCDCCGLCRESCPLKNSKPFCKGWIAKDCTACGKCLTVCKAGLRKISGQQIDSADLAEQLLRQAPMLRDMGGGYTFSGGEPLAQSDFLIDTAKRLKPMHITLQTSGYAPAEVFSRVLEVVDYVLFDIKQTDPELHRKWTGRDNGPILANLKILKASGKPYDLRVPLIPGANDTAENFEGIARLAENAEHMERVELLPYHVTAGAKYAMLGRNYTPGFATTKNPNIYAKPLDSRGIPWCSL